MQEWTHDASEMASESGCMTSGMARFRDPRLQDDEWTHDEWDSALWRIHSHQNLRLEDAQAWEHDESGSMPSATTSKSGSMTSGMASKGECQVVQEWKHDGWDGKREWMSGSLGETMAGRMGKCLFGRDSANGGVYS